MASAGDVQDLHVVEDLHVRLGHRHTDVILGFFQIGGGRSEVQFRQFNIMFNLESVENRHLCSDTE